MTSQRWRRKSGQALIGSFIIMSLLAIAAVTFVDRATTSLRLSYRQTKEIRCVNLCEAGAQVVMRSLWRPFTANQTFTSFDLATSGATSTAPKSSASGTISNVGAYAAGVIAVTSSSTFSRTILIRSVGWIDDNGDGLADPDEAQKVVDVSVTYSLSRSQVFDYTYFVNNYGWMNGFGVADLIVNGDMRANGNFNFSGGSPTVNGSIYACANDKLSPASAGLVNTPPVKWSTATYAANRAAGSSADNELRWRPAYDATIHGAKGTATYEKWRSLLYDSDASVVNGRVAGAVVGDSKGTVAWQRTTLNGTTTKTTLDSSPTTEVIMPDLSDLTVYQTLSSTYVDTKQTFADGTTNPYYNMGSFLDIWNTTLNSGAGGYQRVTTNGQVTGSVVATGTSAHPVVVHGPVAVSQDLVIKGYVKGQGTVYTGRNVHIVGSIIYSTKPSFKGTNPDTIDQANEKADLLGLAARGSVITGNTTTFSNSVLQYMTPPFTNGRSDFNGTWIPAFDANATDSSGRKKYQSVVADATINSMSESVNQIDAVLYTNFVGGGNVSQTGSGVTFNGSLISRDEAMVVTTKPMRMNYDSRIQDRSLTATPLIDINLPRSPRIVRNSWQDRGFKY